MTFKPHVSAPAIFIALASLMATSGSYAANQANASLTNLHIELIDLDLNDGIAPGLTFKNASTVLGALTQTAGGNWVPSSINGAVGAAMGPLTAQVGSVSVAGSLLSGSPLTGIGPGIVVSANVGEVAAGGWANGYAISAGFTLTANTRLLLVGDAAVSINGDSGTTAYAHGDLQLSNQDDTVRYFGSLLASLDPNGALSAPGPGTLQVSFENRTNTSLDGWMLAGASAYVTTPVPEPATYALVLVGLGLLGSVVRRSKSN